VRQLQYRNQKVRRRFVTTAPTPRKRHCGSGGGSASVLATPGAMTIFYCL
jgi:hypothetical protein